MIGALFSNLINIFSKFKEPRKMTFEQTIFFKGRGVCLAIRQTGALEPWRYNLDLALSQTTCVTKGMSQVRREEKKGCLLAWLGR